MSLQLGLALKDQGQQIREVRDTVFIDLMRKIALRLCQEHGKVSTDDLRPYAERMGLTPSHPNSWGCLFKGKHWRAIGRQRSTITSNHGRYITIWAYVDEGNPLTGS